MEKCFGNFSKMEWRKWLELQFSRENLNKKAKWKHKDSVGMWMV